MGAGAADLAGLEGAEVWSCDEASLPAGRVGFLDPVPPSLLGEDEDTCSGGKWTMGILVASSFNCLTISLSCSIRMSRCCWGRRSCLRLNDNHDLDITQIIQHFMKRHSTPDFLPINRNDLA